MVIVSGLTAVLLLAGIMWTIRGLFRSEFTDAGALVFVALLLVPAALWYAHAVLVFLESLR